MRVDEAGAHRCIASDPMRTHPQRAHAGAPIDIVAGLVESWGLSTSCLCVEGQRARSRGSDRLANQGPEQPVRKA